tara:strand:+ start:475 stop:1152 length:678 start_codon:yes stop_codon:yes gene_type:complete
MELNDGTLQVLKNFSGINQNILINQGNTLKTISEARSVVAKATIDAEFEKSFGIYDLNEFIGVLSLVDTPRLKFDDEYVTIGDSTGRSKVKYFFSAEETLTTPSKDITMPAADVKFVLTNDTLAKLKRAASALGHSEVSITNSGGSLGLSVVDSQNSTSNAFSIDVDGEFAADSVFNFVLNIGNLKILPGDYDVEISSKLITQFSHKEMNVQYWIALEKTSTYGV